MRDGRMKVYDKTQIICLASARKRAALKAKGEAEKFKIKWKGHTITEMEHWNSTGTHMGQ